MYSSISAAFGAFQARNQTKKAFENRIERAKHSIPTCGKLPFARAFDKETGTWVVNEKKPAMIRDKTNATSPGQAGGRGHEGRQNHPNITRCLCERCGTSFPMMFILKETGDRRTYSHRGSAPAAAGLIPAGLPEDGRKVNETFDGTPKE